MKHTREAETTVIQEARRHVHRAVIGALHTVPYVVADARALADESALRQAIDAAGIGDDPYERQIHYTALKRAMAQLAA